MTDSPSRSKFPVFDRRLSEGSESLTVIGTGAIGGKAAGLALLKDKVLSRIPPGTFPHINIEIPKLTVIASDYFDAFMKLNNLYDVALSDSPDDRIAHHFLKTELPPMLLGDLRAIVEHNRMPLAIRSSSLLEDAMFEPFAGIYETKMIPNNQPSLQDRFQSLFEAIKFVYASTFFSSAKNYIAGTSHDIRQEKMCVIIQEVMGLPHNGRFYPNISGVGRSYNFYPTGRAKPEQGVVDLALGLGKSIVDGGCCWNYSPAFPRSKPPLSSARELVKCSQNTFWAVNLGKPAESDPIKETEYLLKLSLQDADYDNVLRHIVSTYNADSDRIDVGDDGSGVKVITFAPVLDLEVFPLNKCIRQVLQLCEEALSEKVEIEFALTFDNSLKDPVRFGLLQARPMVVSNEVVELSDNEMRDSNVLVASENVMGNGAITGITDIVYVKPEIFEAKNTPKIAVELDLINRELRKSGKKYLLIGFGRWGSSDHWLGIPVNWGQINGAGVIVESTLPNMYVDLSQGSHFFHNLSSFQVGYFAVRHSGSYAINWDWLSRQRIVTDMSYTCHVGIEQPLLIKLDGRSGRGVIIHG